MSCLLNSGVESLVLSDLSISYFSRTRIKILQLFFTFFIIIIIISSSSSSSPTLVQTKIKIHKTTNFKEYEVLLTSSDRFVP